MGLQVQNPNMQNQNQFYLASQQQQALGASPNYGAVGLPRGSQSMKDGQPTRNDGSVGSPGQMNSPKVMIFLLWSKLCTTTNKHASINNILVALLPWCWHQIKYYITYVDASNATIYFPTTWPVAATSCDFVDDPLLITQSIKYENINSNHWLVWSFDT